MPSVYDFRHVELDKVGRGKRVITGSGSNSSTIFNPSSNGSEGSDLNSISDSGSISSLPSTPVNGMNGLNGSNGNFFSDNMSECSATPPSSASSSRRGSRQEDTKNRLFGEAGVESPRRRVVDRMKSNIFSETPATNGSAALVRSASVKKYDHVIRRNPITGEVYDEAKPANGHNGVNGRINGVNGNGSTSLPATPVKVRQPPGGKCSGIF
ncbi:microtubule-associated protein Jupiter-like [Oppia nitens]|uniref:microtubule-associated protein Jupiter-like n=1 Tax=Oppia nitens TaxID=1686743 RepID=UPI0023DBC13C|nr:microtubule-associated protein Jupiter-like [Oppia nitens]